MQATREDNRQTKMKRAGRMRQAKRMLLVAAIALLGACQGRTEQQAEVSCTDTTASGDSLSIEQTEAISQGTDAGQEPQDRQNTTAAEEFLKSFILSYVDRPRGSLLDSCMTPHAREIYGRMVMEHDCDMLILAQDTPDDFEQTLTVTSQGEGWYRMQYQASPSHKTVNNRFFVTVGKSAGTFRIAYVQGFDKETEGDILSTASLFFLEKPSVQVAGETALEFLRSFYRAYTSIYLSLAADVSHGTAALREKYLNALARQQYEALAQEYLNDGMDNYDALIGGFYTTMQQERTRTIRETKKGIFTIDSRLEILTEHSPKGWLITGIKEVKGGE